ncbi:hypothetical protein E6P09_09100 [Haloferax mediterranei ATCC 33500]|uniref:Uncharacterized protein n=1 Tax=Haloferax mediterranei (strain ATCC 33500 / DSM 1411 / JCM 8866 / NBRC 14739 / NCIMB 2177 / R-4) TaxID=523841 RepID=I3R3X0_HALMT|nr:hypothetical protein [Haloferax mediterranei]AFK18930.1 hypothetical protein HFX_1217 [Haloferax mediterranei ATCC 33500]AHZ21707.1 hypothetical protein BM92_03110 [Haloferax mediterranei ATCC 33500]EMA03211.1 hypothetical protein C439_04415 [Haloferax mediterranei ATCC 33500]MDX5989023.1 hypothetical protein [Haloferax mediterranei ATCC 33500]QCQ75416.1 hypothetical protein E6P09_09100 [Haloferax mediterranei ATCC 33500]
MDDDDDERPNSHPRDQGVVGTEDLDISHDENVAEIDSGRYVISTGDNKPSHPDEGATGENPETPSSERTTQNNDETSEPKTQSELVLPKDPRKRAIVARRLLAERVGAIRSDHALVATALVDGTVDQHETVSNDVTEVFHSLLEWYADAVGNNDTPSDEVLGILLLASEVRVTYPGRAIEALATAHGLGRDDSIGQLLDAVEESGASFPPQRRT